MATSRGSAKLEEVTKLMNELRVDLDNSSLSSSQRDTNLEQLKVFGRDPKHADPIFTKEGIQVLSRHAFNSSSRTTSRNALRCLANALLLKPETRQILVDLNYEERACEILKNDDRDDEFLASRIIFLTTYAPKLDVESLIDKYKLAEILCTNLGRHAAQYTSEQLKTANLHPMNDMALTESLKLLFNLTHFCPQKQADFTPALPHILTLLVKRQLPSSKPLETVTGSLVNALINIPLDSEESKSTFFPADKENINTDRLMEILDFSTKTYTDKELDQLLAPLVALLRRIVQLAPAGMKEHLQKTLLPSTEDRAQVLGKGTSLPSRLLRLTNNASTPSLRESVSWLLYELSNEDAATFVQNVGYGFASGFLFQNKISLPAEALESLNGTQSSNSGAKNQRQDKAVRVNPITGQFLDKEEMVPEVEMTQDEKEREAERLFVLFERLKKTGVVNVENPVTKAFQQGRFEELPDDYDEDDRKGEDE